MHWLARTFAVHILLPVGISFYTFTQIAFLVDAWRGQVAAYALPHYALFVTYFPHLIAGPILHHKDMIPQFEREETKHPHAHLILCGLIIFAIGLFKKTCLADGIQPLVALAFDARAPSFDQAWLGALAYTFQLYFDFSGYSDMAIGISLMFGIFLPVNFNSPYKATSIVEFWRRWHMTLSHFLRDYLYIPLGGNRARPRAPLRQSDAHDAARRALARRGLDFCHLGRAARRLSLRQSRFQRAGAECSEVARAPNARRRGRADISRRRCGLGLLPCRTGRLGHADSECDGRSLEHRLRPRRDCGVGDGRDLCRAGVAGAEHARTSWDTTTPIAGSATA